MDLLNKRKTNHRIAILLTSCKDIDLLNKCSNSVGIAGAYSIIQENESLNMNYFLDYPEITVDAHDLVGKVVSGWYRDEKECDIFGTNEVSIGSLLNYKLAIEFSSTLRYYFAFKEYITKYDKILVSNNIPSSLKFATQCFSDNVEFFQSENQFDEHTTPSPDRGKTRHPPVHKFFSSIFRLIQRPFLWRLKNKVLIINDWTFEKVENPDCLNINKFNPFRSFCLRSGRKYATHADKMFPQSLDTNIVFCNINRVLLEFDLDLDVKNDLTNLFIKLLQKEYSESRVKLINTFCTYIEMFDYYSPAMVVTPGYAHTFYQTIYGISRSKKVPTIFIFDGYPFWLDKYLFPKNCCNKRQRIDYFASFGSYDEKMYRSIFYDDNIKTIKMMPPVISTHKVKFNIKEDQFVVVLFPYGVLHSPYCRWDKKYKYVIDVVNILNDLDCKKIKIKMKTGNDTYQDKENQLMRKLLDKNNISVEIIFGDFSDYLDNAQYVVGSIGTAIVESIYRNIPYYVYEPYSLGSTDEMLVNSFLDKKMISRDLPELKKMILDEGCVDLDKGKIFNETLVDKVDYRSIIRNYHNLAKIKCHKN
jgi:hypothetical protein